MYRLLTYHGKKRTDWMNEEICLLFFFIIFCSYTWSLANVAFSSYLLIIDYLFLFIFLLWLSRSTANHQLNWSERISFAKLMMMSGSWAQLFNFFLEYSKTNCAYFPYWSHTEVNNMLRRNFYRENLLRMRSADRWLSERNFFPMPLPMMKSLLTSLSHFFSIFSSHVVTAANNNHFIFFFVCLCWVKLRIYFFFLSSLHAHHRLFFVGLFGIILLLLTVERWESWWSWKWDFTSYCF